MMMFIAPKHLPLDDHKVNVFGTSFQSIYKINKVTVKMDAENLIVIVAGTFVYHLEATSF